MQEYQIGRAIVRIHGSCDPDRLRSATTKFLKHVETQKRKKERGKTNEKNH